MWKKKHYSFDLSWVLNVSCGFFNPH
jgi:hypothetical protein